MTAGCCPRSQSIVRVHCARVPTAMPERTIARWIEALTDARGTTLARRLQRGAGMESLTGLALLASLSSACHLPPLGLLQWTNRGKPNFPNGPDFSITHSGGFAACAVAPKGMPIGIDMEPVNRARAVAVRLVAGKDERMALDNGTVTATELWTAKEAVLKAAGAGLTEIRGVFVRSDGASFAGADFCWKSYRLNSGLLLAIATVGKFPAIRICWPSPSALFD